MGAVPLTGEKCRAIIERTKRAFAVVKTPLEKLPLWDDLEDVDWLAGFEGAVLDPDNEPCRFNTKRARSGFFDAVRLKRTTVALERAASIPGFQRVIRRARQWRLRIPPGAAGPKAQGSLDHLYEVEVAARLRHLSDEIAFAEPDLMFSDPDSGARFSIACKRPRKSSTVVANASAATDQIVGQGAPGVVMISLDNIIDTNVFNTSGFSLFSECKNRMDAEKDRHWQDLLKAARRYPPLAEPSSGAPASHGILGIMMTASFTLLGRDGFDGEEFLNTRFLALWINDNQLPPWARAAAYTLLQLLEKGEQKLIEAA